jgi:hypothetical protein
MLSKILKAFGYVRVQKQVQAAKPAKKAELQAHVVNAQVRNTLQMARDYYAAKGDRIVSVDLQNMMGVFEEALFLSSTDGASVETCKLLGQIP